MKTLLIALLSVFGKWRRLVLKLKGKTEEDIYEEKVTSGKAWEEFCDNLKSAGTALVYPGAPQDPSQQAEGVRYLSRLTRAGLEAFVEFGDPKYPVFRRTVHETIKMGADNPDNHYLNAQISGAYEYKITGKRNTIHYLGFFTQNGNYGTTGGLAPCGVLEDKDLIIEQDGSFEIMLTKEPSGKNWLKIESDKSLLMVRQTYLDREKEKPSELTIEALNVEGVPGSILPQQIVEGLNTASLFVAGAPMLFSKWAKGFQKHTNQLPMFDSEVSNAAGGDAGIIYYHSHWKLSENEALVVKTTIPKCDTWNFQLNNYWMESLDYRYFPICVNSHSAHIDYDGTVTIVVSEQKPKNAVNWLSTAGHTEGTMCWRWYRPEEEVPQSLSTEVVKIEDL